MSDFDGVEITLPGYKSLLDLRDESESGYGCTKFRDKGSDNLCGCLWVNDGERILRIKVCNKHFNEVMSKAINIANYFLLDRIQRAMDIVFEYGKDEGYR